jgi:hypothetical protein
VTTAGTFSQQFCSLARCGAGGRIVTGRQARNCLVQVAGGELVIVMAPAVLLARVPASMVEIITPPGLRTVGTSVVLWLGGLDGAPLFAVEFDTVYRGQRACARRAAVLAPELLDRALGRRRRVHRAVQQRARMAAATGHAGDDPAVAPRYRPPPLGR